MTVCDGCLIRNRAICASLDDDELTLLNQIGHKQSLVVGETLVWEGDESLWVASVIEGVMKLSTSLEDGREQIVGIAYASDFVGRPFGDKVKETITAITDTHVCAYHRRDFEKFASEHPELEHKLLERTLTELDRARQWMLLLGRKTAREKLATFLIDVSVRLSGISYAAEFAPMDTFKLPFGRQHIADILGLTIETVSRQLTELTKIGLIKLIDQREVVILDRQRLEELADASS